MIEFNLTNKRMAAIKDRIGICADLFLLCDHIPQPGFRENRERDSEQFAFERKTEATSRLRFIQQSLLQIGENI